MFSRKAGQYCQARHWYSYFEVHSSWSCFFGEFCDIWCLYVLSCNSQIPGIYFKDYEQLRAICVTILQPVVFTSYWQLWQLAELFEERCQYCLHKTCLFVGVHPSFRAEQVSHPFSGEQADPGAKRLFHRSKLKDLHGEYAHVKHNA